jgi:prophage antirepressor-like protein
MSNLLTIKNVRGFIDNNGTAQLNLEDVARGLGFTDGKVDKNGIIVIYVRWNTVTTYLQSFGFSQEVAKETFIPENIFYRLAMKAKNETAEKFQTIVCDEILPQIRKTGTYTAKQPKVIDLDAKNKNADARLKNAQTRQAKFMLDHSERFKDLLGKESMSLLVINAFEMITGENTLPRPKLAENKYYTATEIGG